MFICLLASASAFNRKSSRSVWWEGSVCNCFHTPSTSWQRIAARFGAENSATVRVKKRKKKRRKRRRKKRPKRWTTTLQSLSPDFSVSFFSFFLSNGRDFYDVAQLRPQRPHGRRHLDDFHHASPEHCLFSVAVYVHRDRWDYSDVKLTTQDVHLDFHAAPELCGPTPLVRAKHSCDIF